MKNLHIILNGVFDPTPVFEASGSENEYVCAVWSEDEQIAHLNTDVVTAMLHEDVKALIQKGNYDNIFFHPLPEEWYDFVEVVPKDKMVIWCLWGYELYNNSYLTEYINNLMTINLPLTQPWLEKPAKGLRKLYRFIMQKKKELEIYRDRPRFYKVINRIDYVAPIFQNEMEILNGIKGFRAKYFPFQYTRWSLNDEFGWKIDGKDKYILVGNSGYPLNNHLQILSQLKERNITDYTLYLPIAYGNGNSWYIEQLKETLKENNFKYILQESMMPYDEYQKIMSKCSVVIIGSIRQHASDTIYMNILQGAKVFLYEQSVAYRFLKSEGIKVFSIDHDLTLENIKNDMPKEERVSNRQKALELVSEEKTIERLKRALSEF